MFGKFFFYLTVGSLLLTLSFSSSPIQAGECGCPEQVVPILHCVRHNETGEFPNENTAQFSAFFGYENCNGETTIPIGATEGECPDTTNQFLPQFNEDQGQPENFNSGLNNFVFQVDFTGTAEPTWELSCVESSAWEFSVTADTDVNCCGNGVCQGDPVGENSTNCPADCFCGNGVLESGEECEPARKTCFGEPDGEECQSDEDCIIIDRCLQVEELNLLVVQSEGGCLPVDAGNDCRDDCTQPRCGDNILDPGEACDGTSAEACGAASCNGACQCNEEPDDTGQVPPPPVVPPPVTPALELRGNCISSLIPVEGFHPTVLSWGLGLGLSLGSMAYLRNRNRQKK